MIQWATRLVAVCLVLANLGCAGVGPRVLRQERLRYNQAIVTTHAEQLLANLVRLRYLDPPYFLEVSSVSTQYVMGADAAASVSGLGRSGSTGGLGAGVQYEERPTVTYRPLQGQQFVDRLLSPIEMETIVLLSISGWRFDRLMRCCVQRVNDLWNAPTASGPTPDLAPEFEPFLEMAGLVEQLTRRGAIELQIRARDGGPGAAARLEMRLLFHEHPGAAADLARLRALLDLDPQANEFRLTPNPTDRRPDEIAFFPRSVLSTMNYLSQSVEPPQRDIDAGRVKRTLRPDGSQFDWHELSGDLFQVRSSLSMPSDAFVRVRYRNAWFYIDDRDLASKATFNLLDQLFQLQAGEGGGQAPLLTLPVGG